MKLSKLEFVLENCEVITIDLSDCYHHISLGQCHKSYDAQHQDFFEHESTDYAKLIFDSDNFKPVITNDGSSGKTALERLHYCDVTSIVFIFDDNSEKQIYIPWKGWDIFDANKAMKIYQDKTEFYDHIVISFDDRFFVKRWYNAIVGLYYRKVYLPLERYFRERRVKKYEY
jgi:hypothetical protein